jgi:hypothetical protein
MLGSDESGEFVPSSQWGNDELWRADGQFAYRFGRRNFDHAEGAELRGDLSLSVTGVLGLVHHFDM